MDDLVAQFTDADLIRIQMGGNYAFSPDAFGPPGVFQSISKCVPKAPGSTSITLSPSEFGYPNLPFDLVFKAVSAGMAANGAPQIVWAIHQSVGVYLPDADITVDRIDGQVFITLASLPKPFRDPTCGGNCHEFILALNPVIDGSVIVVSGHASRSGHTIGGSLMFTGVNAIGDAAVNLKDLGVAITMAKSKMAGECSAPYGVAGDVAKFYARTNAPPGLVPNYAWSISGTTLVPASRLDRDWIEVNVPGLGNAYSVTVEATVEECIASSRMTIWPLSPVEASLEYVICEYMNLIKFRVEKWKLHPLGPDDRYDPESLAGLRDILARIAKANAELLNQLKPLSEGREMEVLR
jgi:hypothetical protein